MQHRSTQAHKQSAGPNVYLFIPFDSIPFHPIPLDPLPLDLGGIECFGFGHTKRSIVAHRARLFPARSTCRPLAHAPPKWAPHFGRRHFLAELEAWD